MGRVFLIDRSCVLSNIQSDLYSIIDFISLYSLTQASLPSLRRSGRQQASCCSKFNQERACQKPFAQWTNSLLPITQVSNLSLAKPTPVWANTSLWAQARTMAHVPSTTPPLIACLPGQDLTLTYSTNEVKLRSRGLLIPMVTGKSVSGKSLESRTQN